MKFNFNISKSFSSLKMIFLSLIISTFMLLSFSVIAQNTYNITCANTNLTFYVVPGNVQCGDVFNIHCDVTFNDSYQFDGCAFNVDAGVRIIMGVGEFIGFNSCIANTTSTTDTWWGILSSDASNELRITDNGSGCNGAQSTFSNMDNGIYLEHGAQIYCVDTDFRNNSYSIQVFDPPTSVTYPATIERNNFQGTDNMLINSANNDYSFTAIEINNTTLTPANDIIIGSSGNGNSFSGSLIGINTRSVGLVAEDNEFESIGYSSAAVTYDQFCIAITGIPQTHTIFENDFEDGYAMGISIMSQLSTINIHDNLFWGLRNDNVFIRNSNNSEIYIDKNNFVDWGGGNNNYTAISPVSSANCIHADLNDGLLFQPPTRLDITGNGFSNTGIRRAIFIDEPVISANYILQIIHNSISNVRNGIFVRRMTRPIIFENNVSFTTTSTAFNPNCFGIRVDRCNNATIDENTISGDAFDSYAQAGIGINRSANTMTLHNHIDLCGESVYTVGANNTNINNRYLCNQLEHGTYGFFFQNVNVFGPNGAVGNPSDNVWSLDDPSFTLWNQRIIRTGTFALVNWFYRDPFGCTAGDHYDINPFIGNINDIQDCNTTTCQPPYPAIVAGVDEREYFFGNAMQLLVDSLNVSASYYDEVYRAYSFLKSNPEYLDLGTDDADYIDFVYDMDHLNMGNFFRAAHYAKYADSVSYAQDEIDDITPANDWEELWIDVFNVYLATWATYNYTIEGSDLDVLEDAIALNEEDYGAGVIMAQVMLGTETEFDTVPNPYRFEGFSEDENIAFPNPSDGVFKLKVNGPLTFELFDLAGKSLFKKEYTQLHAEIHLPDLLPNGAYLYKVNLTENGFSKSDLLFLVK